MSTKENLIVWGYTALVGAVVFGGMIGVYFMCGRYLGMF